MPAENHVRLAFDDRDHADLKLAAAIDQSQNLKSWCTRVLLDSARRTITDYRRMTAPQDPTPECPAGESQCSTDLTSA